ncbi:MAG: aspartate kinase [Lachnospiraceae bacterium]|nr:aspartate kinase [Lachnospiraceae bacterium]
MGRQIVVAKFGGTSLADSSQFRKVIDIIRDNPDRRYIVVSAPGKRRLEDYKITDLLLACYEKAKAGEPFSFELDQVRTRFQDILTDLDMDFPLDHEIECLEESLLTNPMKGYTAGRGEYLTAKILAECLGFTFVDPSWCICFDENGHLNQAMTIRTIRASLLPLKHAVIAGFYGADMAGTIHTFERGGSDITGSLVACALGADLYENWTDVSGLYSADPRIVKDPEPVPYMTYRELRTLSYMGASVLHSDAVLAASEMEIPINIRNTNRPSDFGTMIMRHLPPDVLKNRVTGVSGRKGMSVMQIEKVMVSDGSGFSALMLDILKNRSLPFEYCLTGIDSITLVIRSDLLSDCRDDLLEEIRDTLNPDFIGLRENLSLIAVTGEKATEASDANVRVLAKLTEENIEISTINQGAGKLNLLIGVPEDRYEDAIRAIYELRQSMVTTGGTNTRSEES